MNKLFTEALDYKNYRLVKQSEEYNDHIFGKIEICTKCLHVQMKSAVCKHSFPISILSFLHNAKTAYDYYETLEVAAVFFLLQFIMDPAKTPLARYVRTTENENSQKERKLTIYF